MTPQTKNSGFTLIELMIAVGIIGILAGIAIPSYNSYITVGSETTGLNNIQTLRVQEEAYRVETFTYLAGTHTAGAASSILMSRLHWVPNDNDVYTYTVTAGLTGDITTSMKITATCDACTAPIVYEN